MMRKVIFLLCLSVHGGGVRVGGQVNGGAPAPLHVSLVTGDFTQVTDVDSYRRV